MPTDYGARVYDGHPAAARIRQVLADSATLDWQSLGGPFDLAIIDGDHSSPMVASDTRGVLSVLAPGGIVLWHDYEWRTVARVVDRAVAARQRIAWIAGTRFAIGIFPDPAHSAGELANSSTSTSRALVGPAGSLRQSAISPMGNRYRPGAP
ncbi:MAG: class I SAM-dependent methyltransferase [Planctomycetia bacterium]|nr:class I SAM-dependent methyltransferase [Planctomycetia bacterium]